MGLGTLAVKYNEEYNSSFTEPSSGSYIADKILVLRENDKSITNLKREQTLKALEQTFLECSSTDWDNYGAKPIYQKAYIEAKKIINWLPTDIPMPEIVPEPTGEIGLEWYRDSDHVFIISVGEDNIISYAGICGKDNNAHGTRRIYFNALPYIILRFIQDVFKNQE